MSILPKIKPVTDSITDNRLGALDQLLTLNNHYRDQPWPAPFDRTTHLLRLGDARDLSWIPSKSVHLVVTSPPYWNLKDYEPPADQLGDIDGQGSPRAG